MPTDTTTIDDERMCFAFTRKAIEILLEDHPAERDHQLKLLADLEAGAA